MMQEILEYLNKNFDTYTQRARLYPAFLSVLPLFFTAIACYPKDYFTLSVFLGVLNLGGGTFLFAQIGRSLSKSKEDKLFKSWGGKPTTRQLRHINTTNKILLERRHKKLQQLITDIQIPTLEEEQMDPQRADEIYEACTKFLINKTRKIDEFPLVFQENCNYGYHRNLWGLKPIGLTLSSLGLFITLSYIIFVSKESTSPLTITGGIANLLSLLAWIFIVTPNWVRTVAEAYAERLLDTCENLSINNDTNQRN